MSRSLPHAAPGAPSTAHTTSGGTEPIRFRSLMPFGRMAARIAYDPSV